MDRFFLRNGISLGIMLACLSFSYGVLSTYLAIYGKEQLGMTSGTGMFFLILSLGLMVSRLTGSRTLRKGLVVRNATLGMCISVFSYLMFASVHNYWGYYGCAVVLGLGNGHMFPAVQTMFVNLAPNNRRGTANSSMLTSWDVGIGLGVVVGGVVAELFNYDAAFWVAWIVNVCGVIFYFAHVRGSYLRHCLR
jgi:predicted MFS family arabinose efflux permease